MSELSDKEILIMMTTKCADLERKLAEAREVLCEYIERRERCNSEVCMNSLYDLRDRLKEKGDE